MKNLKIKAYCPVTNKYFILEAENQLGKLLVYNVVNATKEQAEALPEMYPISNTISSGNFKGCFKCGSKKIAGCSCKADSCNCTKKPVNINDCIYCNKLITFKFAKPKPVETVDRTRLLQGQEAQITDKNNKPIDKILVGVGWDPNYGGERMDVDSSVVMVYDKGDYDLVYFGYLEDESGSVIHNGDNLTGENSDTRSKDDENIYIDFSKVPSDANKLFIILNIYNCVERRQTLKSVKNLYINIYDEKTKKQLIGYQHAKNMDKDTAIVLGVAYKKNNSWHFKALGEGNKAESVRELADYCLTIKI